MQVTAFLVGSCLLGLFSRRSLRHPRSHGFARFVAFEFLLALVALNAPVWFRGPLAARQIVSWVLLAASLGLAVHAFAVFHGVGRHERRGEGPDFAWERTTRLVTSGAYRYIRHPMYASLMLLGAGSVLKAVTLPSLLLGLGVLGALVRTARADEEETAARFGKEYDAYRARTRMFIPWVA
jgi:protein-S-isoprenylcysteine O-methyltransferase Ste14